MKWYFLLIVLSLCLGCRKQFLSPKPDSSIINPTTIDDLQNLLDNSRIVNRTPGLGVLSGDEYYYETKAAFLAAPQIERNAYIWAPEIYDSPEGDDWAIIYNQIFIANTVLDVMKTIEEKEGISKNGRQVAGHAYFVRGFAFYNLLTVFSKSYDRQSSDNDLGIPLKLDPIVENSVQRSTVEASYRQAISDIKQAATLLSDIKPTANRNRPSKSAIYALLSRIYLSMQQYDDALSYADSCLLLTNKLIDYNSISTEAEIPFNVINEENICNYTLPNYNAVLCYAGYYDIKVDSVLYGLYDANDLRKYIFFKIDPESELPSLKPSLNGAVGYTAYSGLGTDEVYLNKAECLARKGKNNEAITLVNTLLSKRYKTNTFQPYTPGDNALDIVLLERRKELVFRGIRWIDLKRLNLGPSKTTLKRVLENESYSLLPNSKLYVLPIPYREISTTGIQQNER